MKKRAKDSLLYYSKMLRLGGWKQVSKQDSQRAANAAGEKPEVCDLDAKGAVKRRQFYWINNTWTLD